MDIVEFQSIFEYELKRKLAQRSRSPQEELRKLISAFKFFDYTSSFILDKNQWIKGVLRTGLCGFNVNDLADVFERYDPNKTGYVNYLNFSNYLYGKEELTPISSDFGNAQINNENKIYNNNNKNKNEFKPPGLYERNFDNNTNKIQLSHYNNSESALNDFSLKNNNTLNDANNNNNINTNNINNNMNNPNNKDFNNNNSNIIQPKNYHMTKSQSQILPKKKNNIIDDNNNIEQKNLINNNINNVNNNNNSESKNYFEKLVNIFRNKINTNNGITYYTFAHALKTLEDKNTKSIGIESIMSIIEQMNLNISFSIFNLPFCILLK
jgi:hypothetical protein